MRVPLPSVDIDNTSSSRRDEFPRSCPPGVVLGITREHILKQRLKDLFLPGDMILFRYREYPPSLLEYHKRQRLANKSKWKGCEICWLDYVSGLALVGVSAISTISLALKPMPSFSLSQVTSRIANITLANLFEGFYMPILIGSVTLPFLAIPYLAKSSTHSHPHLVYRRISQFIGNSNTMADFTQMLHIRSSFWKYLTTSNTHSRQNQPQQLLLLPADTDEPGDNPPSNFPPPPQPTRNPPSTRPQPPTTPPCIPSTLTILFPLQAGEIITILTPYPDLFTNTLLRPLNTLYLKLREWRRHHAAALIYAELENLGALRLDAEINGYLPPVEYQLGKLWEDLNSGNGAGYAVDRREVAGHVEDVGGAAGDFGADIMAVPGILPFREGTVGGGGEAEVGGMAGIWTFALVGINVFCAGGPWMV